MTWGTHCADSDLCPLNGLAFASENCRNRWASWQDHEKVQGRQSLGDPRWRHLHMYQDAVSCPSLNQKERRHICLTALLLFHFFPSSIHKLRENVFQEHQTLKEKELETGPKASHGYGGKFGVEQDRMDKVSGLRCRFPACFALSHGQQSSHSSCSSGSALS